MFTCKIVISVIMTQTTLLSSTTFSPFQKDPLAARKGLKTQGTRCRNSAAHDLKLQVCEIKKKEKDVQYVSASAYLLCFRLCNTNLQGRYDNPFSDERTEVLSRSSKVLQVWQLLKVKQECDSACHSPEFPSCFGASFKARPACLQVNITHKGISKWPSLKWMVDG